MPFLHEKGFMLENRNFNSTQFNAFHTTATRQAYRRQPKLALAITGIDMDMRRLASLV
jgi:hypothetical protein